MFNSGYIGSIELQNRFIRSATAEFAANEDGTIIDEYYELYSNLGKGGIGLIIQGHLYIMDEGKANKKMAGIAHDSHLKGLKQITQLIRKAGTGSLVAAQLNHGGAGSVSSKTASPREGKEVRVMTDEDIEDVIAGFRKAALRAKNASYDAIQIHGAHGYLISQFLSNKTNQRTDSWGGNLENRAQLLLSVYHAIRSAVGNNYPVLVKMNGSDDPSNGFTVEESSKIASWLANEGLDAIEISGNKSTRKVKIEEEEGYFASMGRKIKQHIGDMPLVLVGGHRSLAKIQQLREEFADFISLSRPFIREPDLVQKFKDGKVRADCISCNKCFKAPKIITCLDENPL
ncbi:MAG: NADH:flavin oxidoreductase [Candidatus Hodarchaeales archaeon]|jgi:2,4-dienoyl-CoA reductase-like NADH-dependent reductase (Old Yellow Enzyme family)